MNKESGVNGKSEESRTHLKKKKKQKSVSGKCSTDTKDVYNNADTEKSFKKQRLQKNKNNKEKLIRKTEQEKNVSDKCSIDGKDVYINTKTEKLAKPLHKKSKQKKLLTKNEQEESDVRGKCSIIVKDVDSNVEIEKTSKQRLRKKRKKLKELRKRREANGMLLLPEKIENRIYRLKAALRKKRMPGDKIKEIVRKERRKEENKFKKLILKDKAVCFHCRKPGHQITNCPGILQDIEQGTGICFKCGSTEHKIDSCFAKTEGFPYAKCFICGEQGHLSRSCPKNERGLYPNGGCCNECGKIDHLKKDCPELQKEKGDSEILLPIIKPELSADAEIDDIYETIPRKNKTVKF